jgi:chaperone required for assembly of F1-ATPase
MKRFYTNVTVEPLEEGFGIALDSRPVRTPGRARLAVPPEALARAMAAEWEAQGEKIDPRSMPLTGLANAAIDRIAPDHESFAKGLAQYGQSDLLCYRAEGPAPLVRREADHWDPILAWARRRYDVDFHIVTGIVHRAQPEASTSRLAQAVLARSAFELAGLSPLVTVSGSLLIALALAEEAIGVDQAWTAATVDESWQAEMWGEDEEAVKALAARRADFDSGALFLSLLR